MAKFWWLGTNTMLTEVRNKAGLNVNLTKTKYMIINKDAMDLQVAGKVILVCKGYKYLGVMILPIASLFFSGGGECKLNNNQISTS